MSNILKGMSLINEISDISGLLAASKLNRSFIIVAKTYEGPTKKYRVKAQSKNIAIEKFKKHYSMAEILDVQEESNDDSHWNFGSGVMAEGKAHISPSGVKTTMDPSDDDYDINYSKQGLVAKFRKEQGLDVKTGSKKVKKQDVKEGSKQQRMRQHAAGIAIRQAEDQRIEHNKKIYAMIRDIANQDMRPQDKTAAIDALQQKIIKEQGVQEGAPELLKAEMPLVRHIERELIQHGYQKGTEEYKTMFNHALSYYRKFGNVDQIKKQDVEEGQIYSGGNKEAGVRWYKPRHVPNQDELDESLRTENPCWKGYHPVGTKKKNGKTVPNCVPVKKESAIMKGLQTEGNDEEFHTGGGKGLPYPGTYEQETLPYRTKGQKRTQAIAFENK